jgi:IS5 family transposase
VPDHATLSRFRSELARRGLAAPLLAELNRQLDAKGLVVKTGTQIDASLVAADRQRPLSAEGHARNRAIGKIRAAVERSFATLKRWYGYRRVRYRSLVRNGLQLQPLALAMNLRRALVLTA